MSDYGIIQGRRARVDSCLDVIKDIRFLLGKHGQNPRIVKQLYRLDELLSILDQEAVTDNDLDRIEGSTNQLLNELSQLFEHQGLGHLYQGPIH